ncbi:MAG: (2Fe-2S) ferredoxin domain-containing protein [Ignavibacteriae bacterium]|nr:(2Fe-2S) ferredoxin domain-containing protein [Ignavibacteriota bacterium]
MTRFERHVFICENQRPEGHPRGCCANKGSKEVRARFREALRSMGLNDVIRANSAGCLDACEFGVSLVVYPDAVWYGGVTVDDVEEIVESHIVGGTPVERLRIKDAAYGHV